MPHPILLPASIGLVWLCLGSPNGSAGALDPKSVSWQAVHLQKLPNELATAMALSPDGSRLACAFDDGTLVIWNCSDGNLIAETTIEANPLALLFTGTNTVCAGTAGGAILRWNFGDEKNGQVVDRLAGAVRCLLPGKNRGHPMAAVLSTQPLERTKVEWAKLAQGLRFEVWSLDLEHEHSSKKVMGPIKGWLLKPTFCSDRKILAVVWASVDEATRETQFWMEFLDAKARTAIKRLSIKQPLLDAITYDLKNSCIIARSADGIVEISVPDGRVLRTLRYGRDLGTGPLAVAGLERRIALANSKQDEVLVLTYPELKPIARIPEIRAISEIEFSPDGNRIAILHPGIRLYKQKLEQKGRDHP